MFRNNNRAPLGKGGSALTGSATRRKGAALFPPHLFPPPGATGIFKADVVGTVGAGIYSPAGLQFQLPKGTQGAIRSISLFIDGITAATSVLFTVRVNGVAPNGLSNLQVLARDAASMEKIFDQWALELPDSAQVDVQIQQLDGGAYRLGATLEGWYYNAEATYVE